MCSSTVIAPNTSISPNRNNGLLDTESGQEVGGCASNNNHLLAYLSLLHKRHLYGVVRKQFNVYVHEAGSLARMLSRTSPSFLLSRVYLVRTTTIETLLESRRQKKFVNGCLCSCFGHINSLSQNGLPDKHLREQLGGEKSKEVASHINQ